MWIVLWNPLKDLSTSKVLWVSEQCTGPIDRHISVKILLVKEVVGPMHIAQDPLTDKIPREMHFLIIKKKKRKRKKENTNVALETQSKRVLNGIFWMRSTSVELNADDNRVKSHCHVNGLIRVLIVASCISAIKGPWIRIQELVVRNRHYSLLILRILK